MKKRLINSLAELEVLEEGVVMAAAAAADRLHDLLSGARDLTFLARLKFEACGYDPLDAARPLNLVEQLNQSFTCLATIEGTKWLMDRHPEHVPYQLNLSTAAGSDIASLDGAVIAETFAATHPDSNNKLQKDVQKLLAQHAQFRYVFYLSNSESRKQWQGVTVIRLDHLSLINLRNSEPTRAVRSTSKLRTREA